MGGPRMDIQQLCNGVGLVRGSELRCDADAFRTSQCSKTTVVATIAAAPTPAAASKPRAPFAPLTSHTTSCASFTAQHAAAAHPATSATSVAARATSLP